MRKSNVAKIIVKNENKTIDIPNGERLADYLWAETSFPQGCEDGSSTICALVVIRGEENLNKKTHIEGITLAKASVPNSSRNRLACQVRVLRGEIEIEY